jgi:hypothetical protein
MSTTTRVIAFGAISGLIWSAIAAVLSGLNIGITVIISGILTGVLVSLALKSPLQIYGRWSGFVFGALSLPAGAFVFGVIISLVQMAASRITGSGDFQFIAPDSNPIQNGMAYAFISVVSLFVVALLPLAVLTTFILRAVIHKHETAA